MSAARRSRFRRVRLLSKGYDTRQVDAFLARADLALRGALPAITAREIRQTGFELVHRGYEVEQVDAALDKLELEAVILSTAASRRGRLDPAAEVTFLRQELSGPYMQRFPRLRFPRRGYDIDDVDDFLDRVGATLDRLAGTSTTSTTSTAPTGRNDPTGPSGEAPGAAGGLTVADVRNTAFRPKRGGYAEDPVDEALDRVVEVMLLLEAGTVLARRPLDVAGPRDA